jgi:hypothetical protein
VLAVYLHRGKLMRILALISATVSLLASGCATIVTDAGQSLRVETFTDQGEEIKGAQCLLDNANGHFTVISPGSVMVRKSSDDLMIACSIASQPDAKAVVSSRVGAGMFGNIIFGGGVGAIIDHAKGTAYNYPTWLQLVFGKQLSFDRQEFKEGQPTPAFELKEGKREPYSQPNAVSGGKLTSVPVK